MGSRLAPRNSVLLIKEALHIRLRPGSCALGDQNDNDLICLIISGVQQMEPIILCHQRPISFIAVAAES